jgi:uncharacterized protein YqgC (DUF456 family)
VLTRLARKVMDWILGLGLIALGILGGFIPFLPGWVLVVAGLAVLSSHSRWAHAIHVRLRDTGHRALRWIGAHRPGGSRDRDPDAS